MKLIWKPLTKVEHEEIDREIYGKYMISEKGDIFSVKFSRNVTLQMDNGYFKYNFNGPNDSHKTAKIHRLVGLHFCDGWFEGAIIDHKDGNPANNHYTNLHWTTYKGNSRNPISLERTSIASKLKWSEATPEKRKAYGDAISAGKKGKLPQFKDGIHPRLGATHTEEARAKISAANLERHSGKDMILTSTDLDGNKLHYRTWIEAWEQSPDSKRSIRESRNTGSPTKNGLIWTSYTELL